MALRKMGTILVNFVKIWNEVFTSVQADDTISVERESPTPLANLPLPLGVLKVLLPYDAEEVSIYRDPLLKLLAQGF